MVGVREAGVVVDEDKVEHWVGFDPFNPEGSLENSSQR